MNFKLAAFVLLISLTNYSELLFAQDFKAYQNILKN